MKIQFVSNVIDSKNTTFQDYEIVSRRAVELAFRLRMFKFENQLTWTQIEHIASIYGKRYNTKFYQANLAQYANFKKTPSEPQMKALLDMMDITIDDLSAIRQCYN